MTSKMMLTSSGSNPTAAMMSAKSGWLAKPSLISSRDKNPLPSLSSCLQMHRNLRMACLIACSFSRALVLKSSSLWPKAASMVTAKIKFKDSNETVKNTPMKNRPAHGECSMIGNETMPQASPETAVWKSVHMEACTDSKARGQRWQRSYTSGVLATMSWLIGLRIVVARMPHIKTTITTKIEPQNIAVKECTKARKNTLTEGR
mmetsp:Transcript_70955/g.217467  ORF Transcript_70955/g.217467 Transcript_70955/m.217467 type:complete len:204 (-) Transcript_70955:299-910(-)